MYGKILAGEKILEVELDNCLCDDDGPLVCAGARKKRRRHTEGFTSAIHKEPDMPSPVASVASDMDVDGQKRMLSGRGVRLI